MKATRSMGSVMLCRKEIPQDKVMMSQRKAKEKEEQYADNQSNVGRYQ